MTKNEKLLYNDIVTIKYIMQVRDNIGVLTKALSDRAKSHDKSKMKSPEREAYSLITDRLRTTKDGGVGYKEFLDSLQPAIAHHKSQNRHHPEAHLNGINGMDLVDIMEMLADWIAAVKRDNGDIHKSIKTSALSFHMNPQLVAILTNTVNRYF